MEIVPRSAGWPRDLLTDDLISKLMGGRSEAPVEGHLRHERRVERADAVQNARQVEQHALRARPQPVQLLPVDLDLPPQTAPL